MSIFQSLWYEKIRQIVLWREKLEYLSKPLINIFLLCFQFQTTRYMSRIRTSKTTLLRTTVHLMVSCCCHGSRGVCYFVVDLLKPINWATPNTIFLLTAHTHTSKDPFTLSECIAEVNLRSVSVNVTFNFFITSNHRKTGVNVLDLLNKFSTSSVKCWTVNFLSILVKAQTSSWIN